VKALPKQRSTNLSVFKGREARLNRAIFQTLALKGPQTIYDIHKQIRTRKEMKRTHYSNVNRRVRELQNLGYTIEARIKNTKAGFKAAEYELTMRAYLALMLDSVKLEDAIERIDENTGVEILAGLTNLV
jgi:hypothetical protein